VIVLVEGPDGSGKTTLVGDARRGARNVITIARSGPMQLSDMVQFMWWSMASPDLGPNSYVIHDRYPAISERVYGPILRERDLLESYDLDFGLTRVDAIVYCRTAAPVYDKEQMEGVIDNGPRILAAYDALMERIHDELGIPIYLYDFKKHASISIWERIFRKEDPTDEQIEIIERSHEG
jgi:hypothetical protein